MKQRTELRDLTEDGVGRVHGDLVLSRITDQTLRIGKSDVRRRRSVTLVVSYDLNTVVLPYSDAGVRGSEIDSDRWTFSFSGHYDLPIGCVDEEEFNRKILKRDQIKIVV